ncbi:ABC transporter permease [Alkaliphilus hydrothermalis]|uniref:ABC-2 type transport system permease protein n=1 Tax=Alkaliphilus hydrothermalis TaxID=1482730 RepID=A0ABS2NQX1_9FIRM|nr:ABC transporter permease [Alkaliphilus hydrothermalis]MBM7615352.1 ABC-2 type transport system permease protein [Alkaliphilus hydrothermalis]
MILFRNNVKRILKEKSNLVTMIVVPVFFIIMIIMMNSGGGYILKVGIVDEDATLLTEMLQKNLDKRTELVPMTEEELQEGLINMKVDYGIVIPKGFTEDLIDLKNPQLTSYRIKEGNIALPTIIYIENFLGGAKYLAEGTQGNEDLFYQGLMLYKNGSMKMVSQQTGEDKTGEVTLASLGFLVMSMMFFSTFSANMVLEDRENKTFYRVLASPLSLKKYMLENQMTFLALSQLQVILVFLIMKFVFKMYLGPSFINLYILLFIFSLVSVSFGTALTGLAKDTRQVNAMASFLISPMVMLGGGFWPREIMPEILQTIGKFVPITWVLQGAEKILSGQSLGMAMMDISILLLFSLIFFLLGTWRRADVSL